MAFSTGTSRVTPDQVVTSAAEAGPNAPGSGARSLDVRLHQRPSDPALERLVDDAPAALPGAARRALHQRRRRAGELAGSVGAPREPLGQSEPERLLRPRAVGEQVRQRRHEAARSTSRPRRPWLTRISRS